MITIERTFSPILIRTLVSRDFNLIKDDSTPDKLHWIPNISENWFYLIPMFDGEPCGLVAFNKMTGTMAECHVNILKEFRGKGSKVLVKLALEWMRENAGIKRFLAFVPKDRPLAKRLAESCNFKKLTTIVGGLSRNNVLIDLDLLGTE